MTHSSIATPEARRLAPPSGGARLAEQPDPRASVAAFLSFLFSGLGQAYNGHTMLAWLLAGPLLLLLLAVGLSLLLGAGVTAHLLDIRFLVGLIVLDLALLGWRLVAIIQAHVARQPFSHRHWTTYLTAFLVIIAVVMHALPAFYAVKGIETINSIALGGDRPTTPGGIGDVPELDDLSEPSDQPDPLLGHRVNVLLVGVDAATGRATQLTDTMLVVSFDPDGRRSAMISVPRDTYGVPLPDGRTYNRKLNSLMTIASGSPSEFPLGGVGTLKATIGELLGIRIHYFAAINLEGFKQGIDTIGGVDVMVERAVNDPSYVDPTTGVRGFNLTPGLHHMNGDVALAFVRSRMGAGDSDFTRAERQQQLLAAVREKLTAHNLVVVLPGLLDAVRASLATDIPAGRIPELAAAVQEADMSQLERIVLTPPEFFTVEANHPTAGYVLHPHLDAIRAIGQELAGDD
jgi:polyisoprenyl-teichoic acid--peptidoglycan teichoic acid transferase